MDKEGKKLIGVREVMSTYGFGRTTAVRIMTALPHVRIGLRLFVQRSDLEAFLEEAKRKGMNISAYAKKVLAEKKLAGVSNEGVGDRGDNK